jgi:hypothetical protein
MRLYCRYLPSGFSDTALGGVTLNYISEESPNNVEYCPSNSVMVGMVTNGSYSDNIALQCHYVNFPPQGVSCRWTTWLSEEQGTLYFDPEPNRPGLGVAIGVSCSGSYCDNMQFLACEPQCTSSADCGAYACVNGRCVVG